MMLVKDPELSTQPVPNKREVLLNPLYAQDKLTVAEQVASKCTQIFGAVTSIWTPDVTRSQLKSDKITKIWTSNVLSTQLESDRVIRIWILNVKRLQLRSDKVTLI